MNRKLLRAVAALVVVVALPGDSLVLLFRVKTAWPARFLEVAGLSWFLLTFAKRFICCHGWAVDVSIAAGIMWIYWALFLMPRRFPRLVVDGLARRETRG